MSAIKQTFLSSEHKNLLTSFINIIQKRGNKQRALSTLFSLFNILKLGIAGYPTSNNYPLHTLDEKNPIKLIHRGLYNLKPAFLIRRVIKSGRRYDLPIPISENRAQFMSIDWLRKAVFKNNKNDSSFAFLVAREISASLHREGSAKDFLKAYIDIALDQQPFNKFIKRRRNKVSKSKRTKAASRFKKIRKAIRRTLRARKYRNIRITRKINIHNIRTTTVKKYKPLKRILFKKTKQKEKKIQKRAFRIKKR